MSLVTFVNQKFNKPDIGLLVLRLIFGLIIVTFGVQKLMGGGPMLESIGGAMAKFGITWQPKLWGLLAALTETLGGVCIVLGLVFRPAALLLFLNMVVATTFVWGSGPDFSSINAFAGWFPNAGMAVTFCAVFLALLFTGPGKYAVHTSGGGRGGSKSSGD